jgi:ribose 1,5-bisphosphokinase
MVPWPEGEWRAMRQEGLAWRAKLRARPGAGTLFLLDGASCSGKSTLVDRLTAGPGALDLVPRYSTRERRQDDQRRREYIFVSPESFRASAEAGAFIEYRDFLFGMSYGLPWAEAFAPLLEGRPALGVINLGNVEHVKALVPEALTILVDASLDTIRHRLVARGVNTPEQIEERLANAARVEHYRSLYDYVVTNEEGGLGEAEATLRDLIASRAAAGS